MPLVEHAAQVLRGHRLGERSLERGHVLHLHAVAQTTFGEEGVREEGELERCHRALDGHLGDVDDQASTGPVRQLRRESLGSVEGVELVDVAAQGVGHPGRLLGPWRRSGRDDELVVAQGTTAIEDHSALGRQHPLDLGVDEPNSFGDEPAPGLADLVGPVDPERDEQESRLVVVRGALIDDRDRPLLGGQASAELVRRHRSRGATTQDDQLLRGLVLSPVELHESDARPVRRAWPRVESPRSAVKRSRRY